MEHELERFKPSSLTQREASIHFRLLGALPLMFFLFQGIHYWRINELGNMLWMCNICNLMLALGLFLCHAQLIRVSVLWMIPGLVVWFIYVVLAWGIFFSSTLAHVGGMLVALVAVKKVGMDRRAWIYGVLWYFVLQVVSRIFTPANLNVNISHNVDPGWQGTFNSYWKFWVVLTLAVGIVLWILSLILRKLFPPNLASPSTC